MGKTFNTGSAGGMGAADKETLQAILADTEAIKTDISGVKDDVASVKTDVSGVKDDVAGVKADVGTVKTDVAGVKTTADNILAELTSQKPKRYGYRIKKSEPDPYTRVEYIYDAEGMTPAHMDFSGESFNYGSWRDIWFIRDNYACMLNADGTEAYRLNPDNYATKLGDSAASDVSKLDTTMNAMSAIPLCYVKRWEEGDYEYTVFCETRYDDSYEAYAHVKADGSMSRVAYHPCFKGCLDAEDRLRSIAGQYPQYITAAQAEIDAAKKNGPLWNIRPWSLDQLIWDLCTLISKSDNCEAAFGHGQTSGYVNNAEQHYGHLQSGTLMDKGQFFGYDDTTHAVKVFHIENFWGGRWDRLVGLIQRGGVYLAKMTPEGDGYNLTGAGYTPMAKSLEGLAASGSGWQQGTHNSPLGRVPVAPFTGTDATYTCAFMWWNMGITAVAFAGGDCHNGSRCGRVPGCNVAASRAAWDIGASPTCEGPSV